MNSEIFNAVRTLICSSHHLEDIRTRLSNATNNVLVQKGFISKTKQVNIDNKELECDYILRLVNKAIFTAIDNNKEKVEVKIDKNMIDYLKTHSFESCNQYRQLKSTTDELGIRIDIMKSYREINSIEFNLLRKQLDIYH
jgi:ribosomal protein S8